MNRKQIVVLFGDSLFMDTIEAGLGAGREFGLVRVTAGAANIARRLDSFHPDIVIFDVIHLDEDLVLSLLKNQADTLFLGLDITTHQIIALCSQCYTARSLAELTRIIRQMQRRGNKTEPFPPELPLEKAGPP
ncbi:MAG: hypothetical protein Kow0031_20780 [Anaerolineae bacterium]